MGDLKKEKEIGDEEKEKIEKMKKKFEEKKIE